MDVAAWLASLGLEQYAPAFRDNAIDAELLPELTEGDLEKLGVAALGHRKRLLKAIEALRHATEVPGKTAARGPIAPTSLPDDKGERRQVTVLFADIAGYTAMASELDAEELHALLDRFFRSVDRIVEEYGGHIDKHIGDCVMGVFGAPVAHGNDAERAARAALAIRDAMPALSAEMARPIGVHIGLARELVVLAPDVILAGRRVDGAIAPGGRSISVVFTILPDPAVLPSLDGRSPSHAPQRLHHRGYRTALPVMPA